MKSWMAVLMLLLLLAGCSGRQAVFDTENVQSVMFFTPDSEGVAVPAEELDTVLQWLDTFTVAQQAGEPLYPGTQNISVRLQYADGRVIESSLATVTVDDEAHYMECAAPPIIFLTLTAGI